MIYVIGIGPGAIEKMSEEAKIAINRSDIIVGYKTYIKLIESLLTEQEVISNGMRGEVERCKEAIERSRTGKTVSVISSGDAGVYGMAGLIYELANADDVIKVIPGITASSASAACLGAPLMHDYCHISLSDLLTPYDLIMDRVKHAAHGDFVICFYNPKSHGRKDHIKVALDHIRAIQGDHILVGVVKDASREEEASYIFKIDEVDYDLIDMTSMVIVGNQATKVIHGKMVTPRGYHV
ncbi:precorrin-3B C(17)-methyltransferase [Fusibacter ferrireducens]|uniref:Precorrin-3B C(17)-methyltransferase n=1 Tax=Fusibacter ferrireducens TaxID=2785058 RepID=A0ABR9ZS16_9FIRM|nr:precorrin-3B C(17)-methyltransferase [Fusibacter ferrireducens]MBF4693251.1 precorrin-3B C(17)-methyltransferase [Fusibacter ferrireducens]